MHPFIHKYKLDSIFLPLVAILITCVFWYAIAGKSVVTEKVDDFFSSSCISAGCSAKCLAESSSQNVYSALNAAVLRSSSSCLSNKTSSVTVVYHNESVVFVSHVAHTLKVSDDAVH